MTGNSHYQNTFIHLKAVRALPAIAAVCLGLLAVQPAAEAGDAATGKALALQWCSSCHLVSNDQQSASSVSLPSFYDVAKDPSWTEVKLRTFLADPHPKMPNMNLGNTEVADLASYIGSLAP